MGRASNPAAPQRVSAHVLPKVPTFSADDEDEKTMIESGWEEESSTTVEQGEVAEKLRALGLGLDGGQRANSSITSTNAGGTSEEPTVDDQRASAAIALLPPPIVARLVITQGNDSGQALEVRAGKTYTIGRGIDNDLVLTDIAVSRKHFDVRNDNGAWVIADRGSGNGTLVNQRIEDAPFVLASGDVIEIGNTSFRFDVPNGVPRGQALSDDGSVDDRGLSPGGGDAERRRGLSDDDLELANAGQTIRDPERVQTPAPLPGLPSARSKTQPPPGMLPATLPPPRGPMNRPLVGYGLERPGTQSQPPPPSALAVTIGPVHTALPASPLAQSTLPLPQMANRPPLGSALRDAGNGAGTTLPGSGPASPAPPRRAFSYPGTLSSPSQPQPRPRPSASTQAVRDPTSTAQVQPITYAGGAALAPQPRGPQRLQISPRTRLALIAAAAVLIVAVVTLAIISSTRSTPVAPPPAPRAETPPPPRPAPIVEAIHEPPTSNAIAAPFGSAAVVPRQAPAPVPPLPTTAPQSSKLAIVVEPLHETKPPPVKPPVVAPPVVAPPVVERSAVVRPRVEATPPRIEIRKPAPKRVPDRKPEPKKPAPSKMEIAPILDSDKPDVMPTKNGKRASRTPQDVKSEAMALYKAKNFNGASAVVTAALPAYAGGDAQDLRTIASVYTQLGKSYNFGMAPGTKATDAYIALLRARSFDRDLGGSYIPEIEKRLATVSARAALSFMAAKEYESAAQAVKVASDLGTETAATTKSVREALEGVAGELVRAAQAELTSNPDAAKKKLRQVQGIVDARHPAAIKATKLLSGL
jgi:pSer/pThr/pTyr-binding forkhead associated (FHA) protein